MDPPAWTRAVDPPLRAIAGRIRVLGSATPLNADSERVRLLGDLRPPRWRYRSVAMGAELRALETLLASLDALDESDGLADVYRARIEELALEARLCEAVGTRAISRLALARFGPLARASERRVIALAKRWLAESPPVEAATPMVTSDDEADPLSLVRRLRLEVAKRGLQFQVVTLPGLSSLASTGEGTLYVARGRSIEDVVARRTVLHELEGHALPRAKARSLAPAIFQVGTARGTDEQEGYALVCEERGGYLEAGRRRELAARFFAVEWMRGGCDFVESVERLTTEVGVPRTSAIYLAERAYRGGDGSFAGLGRERCYLEAYIRVRDHLARRPEDAIVFQSGQVSLPYFDALRTFATSA